MVEVANGIVPGVMDVVIEGFVGYAKVRGNQATQTKGDLKLHRDFRRRTAFAGECILVAHYL